MFEKARARKSFENCAVRAVIKRPQGSPTSEMVCPKYPEGFEVSPFAMKYNDDKTSLAMSLGCLSCPYRNVELPAGESAIQAIRRISDQSTIEHLTTLFEDQPADQQQPNEQG